MRRWNGWGDDTITYPLPDSAGRFLELLVGPGTPPRDAALEAVTATVPESRLPAHALVDPDPLERLRHARGQSFPDWLALRSGRRLAFPDGIARPTTDADVRSLIDYAQTTGARLIPYGGGTSVVGHINPAPGDAPILTVDMGRLNRLRRFDETSHLATFGAGIIGPDLEAQLRARGCTLGHFPQSFELSTLGGWVVTRSSGQQSLRYGRIERMFSGGVLESPAGRLTLPNFPASAAGPDLREIVLGSEGRLGVLTEVTVRVTPLPEREDFHAIFFPDWERGLVAVRQISQSCLPLSMLRYSTPTETETTLRLAGHERLIGTLERLLSARSAGAEKCMLLVGFTGQDALVKMARKEVLGITRKHNGIHVGRTFGSQWHKGRFKSPYLRNTLWELGYGVDTLETATDWGAVPAMVEAVESALRGAMAAFDERIHVFTHLSHFYPYGSSIYTTYLFRLSPDPDETLERWQAMKAAASQAVVGHGGTISHQHGVGVDHKPYLPAEKGELGMAAIGDLCKRFDPEGIMNPGKLLDREA
ncbi:MAG: FAD-binding oxidoreductase [Chloroflexi bacterium]|nr:FAD-binding oxidoreductase [Chloroflexota bacterium]MBU1661194.1 FAD-binding oxidoreductase [Chloroflexota bacterium]